MEKNMKFSIIVVCLNAGEKLHSTLKSILEQTETDYEVVIKDGGSTDGSTERIVQNEKIRLITQKDKGIYDAMNQAVRYAGGEYLFFLNCGDCFYDERVLETVKEFLLKKETSGETEKRRPYIFYGNIKEQLTGALVQSNPEMDDFGCYRNVPCHQACFYSRELLTERGFDLSYKVRADYEHFLWSYYRAKALTVYMPVLVTVYEGGGFSETAQNRKLSAAEHREIVGNYMPPAKVRRYKWIMLLTLSGLRTFLARSKVTAGAYNRIKKCLYKRSV